MTQWFVKDLSKLTGISVQTLHHYDRKGLLKPSLRLPNGYRVYSQDDLLKLQQIIALKFFGFSLSEVKNLLEGEGNILKHLDSQVKVLEQKAATLQEAAETLKGIVASVDDNSSIPWETIIKMIEVYKMTAALEHDWVKEIFTPDELREYAAFESEMKATHSKEIFEKRWQELLAELKQYQGENPDSDIAIAFAGRYMDWLNGLYGKKYAHLRTKKWEKGFGEGKGLADIGMTPALMVWLEKAIEAYWKDRFKHILEEVGQTPDASILILWNQALDELYGEEAARKQAIYETILKDDNISPQVRVWLEKYQKSDGVG